MKVICVIVGTQIPRTNLFFKLSDHDPKVLLTWIEKDWAESRVVGQMRTSVKMQRLLWPFYKINCLGTASPYETVSQHAFLIRLFVIFQEQMSKTLVSFSGLWTLETLKNHNPNQIIEISMSRLQRMHEIDEMEFEGTIWPIVWSKSFKLNLPVLIIQEKIL